MARTPVDTSKSNVLPASKPLRAEIPFGPGAVAKGLTEAGRLAPGVIAAFKRASLAGRDAFVNKLEPEAAALFKKFIAGDRQAAVDAVKAKPKVDNTGASKGVPIRSLTKSTDATPFNPVRFRKDAIKSIEKEAPGLLAKLKKAKTPQEYDGILSELSSSEKMIIKNALKRPTPAVASKTKVDVDITARAIAQAKDAKYAKQLSADKMKKAILAAKEEKTKYPATRARVEPPPSKDSTRGLSISEERQADIKQPVTVVKTGEKNMSPEAIAKAKEKIVAAKKAERNARIRASLTRRAKPIGPKEKSKLTGQYTKADADKNAKPNSRKSDAVGNTAKDTPGQEEEDLAQQLASERYVKKLEQGYQEKKANERAAELSKYPRKRVQATARLKAGAEKEIGVEREYPKIEHPLSKSASDYVVEGQVKTGDASIARALKAKAVAAAKKASTAKETARTKAKVAAKASAKTAKRLADKTPPRVVKGK